MDENMLLDEVMTQASAGQLVPYFGPGVLDLSPGGSPVPSSPEALAERLVAKVTVPHKIRKNLTAAAQYIENFKHRKTLTALLTGAFQDGAQPGPLHHAFAAQPLIVDAWYDDAMQTALQGRRDWGQIQGLSQAEHFGTWTHCYRSDGSPAEAAEAAGWNTLLYQPLGSIAPAGNFLVSDSDYVEVLTEIDIQTPIPEVVQRLRAGRHFLFLGCRFRNQLERAFARQIMKRSSDTHWAVLEGELTRNEARFLEEQGIRRIDMTLQAFGEAIATRRPEVAAVAG